MNTPKTEKKSCGNCHSIGQIEQGHRGPIDCPACKGKGYIEVIKNVERYDLNKENEDE